MNLSLTRGDNDCLSLLKLARGKLTLAGLGSEASVISEVLLCEVLKISRTQLYLENPEINGEEFKTFWSYLDSVISGKPLAYVLGKTFFFGLEFYINEHCFIPRPETELLVEKTIEKAHYLSTKDLLIYDVCTGIGSVAVSLTKSLTYCKIMATDISKEALEIAHSNSLSHNTQDRLKFICCDLLSSVSPGNKADIIVSNPPYIKSDQIKALPDNVRLQPHLALDGGVEGLRVIRRLFEVSQSYLKRKGFLIFEFGYDQKHAVCEIAMSLNVFSRIEIIKDYNNYDRIFIGRLN